jgi:hypothetical protein
VRRRQLTNAYLLPQGSVRTPADPHLPGRPRSSARAAPSRLPPHASPPAGPGQHTPCSRCCNGSALAVNATPPRRLLASPPAGQPPPPLPAKASVSPPRLGRRPIPPPGPVLPPPLARPGQRPPLFLGPAPPSHPARAGAIPSPSPPPGRLKSSPSSSPFAESAPPSQVPLPHSSPPAALPSLPSLPPRYHTRAPFPLMSHAGRRGVKAVDLTPPLTPPHLTGRTAPAAAGKGKDPAIPPSQVPAQAHTRALPPHAARPSAARIARRRFDFPFLHHITPPPSRRREMRRRPPLPRASLRAAQHLPPRYRHRHTRAPSPHTRRGAGRAPSD